MRVIAYSSDFADGVVTIQESTGQFVASSDLPTIFDFLLEPFSDAIKVSWDIDEFLSSILQLFPRGACIGLAKGMKVRLPAYSVFYIAKKMFNINRKPSPYLDGAIYSLSQYWPEEHPVPDSVFDVASLGNSLLQSLSTVGVVPRKLTSPIAVYKETVFSKLDLPTVIDTPDSAMGAQEYALKCTSRLWVSNYKVGHWLDGEVWDYDLSGAFPSVAAGLLDTRYAEYIHSTDHVSDAYWGFLKGVVTVNPDIMVSPIITELQDGTLVNPVGTWPTYLTMDEVRFIERHNLGSFKLDDGWFLKFNHGSAPLRSVMADVYSQRRGGSDPVLDKFLKRSVNGLIGQFIENRSDGSLGSFYNPIWHAVVTSNVRLKVAEFIYQHSAQDNLIHVGVDGCMFDKELALPSGDGLGKWRLTGTDPVIVVSPGLVFTKGKHPKGIYYDKLLNMIGEHPMSSRYEAKLQKRLTLFGAIQGDCIADVGKVKDYSSVVDLGMALYNQDRVFDKFPKTGKQLLSTKYSSVPLTVTSDDIGKINQGVDK